MGRGAPPRRRGIRLRRRAGILLVLGLVLAAYLYYRPVQSYLDTARVVEQRQAEVRRLTRAHSELQKRLALDESGATLVREARRLGLVRPDEQLVIVKGIEKWRKARKAAADR